MIATRKDPSGPADLGLGRPDTTRTGSGPSSTVTFFRTTAPAYTATKSASSTPSPGSPDFVKALVGGVIGGVVGLTLLGSLACLLRRRGLNGPRPLHASREQPAAVLSPVYPASPDWVYEPWTPMSSNSTVLTVTVCVYLLVENLGS